MSVLWKSTRKLCMQFVMNHQMSASFISLCVFNGAGNVESLAVPEVSGGRALFTLGHHDYNKGKGWKIKRTARQQCSLHMYKISYRICSWNIYSILSINVNWVGCLIICATWINKGVWTALFLIFYKPVVKKCLDILLQ